MRKSSRCCRFRSSTSAATRPDGLGTGPSKELADQIGVGGVYVRHLRRMHDLLRDKYGKRMMMWGDIILNHPENLNDLRRTRSC